MSAVGVGIVGTGVISDTYLTNLGSFPDVEVVALGDIIPEKAVAQGEKYGVKTAGLPELVYDNPDVQLIVNLTIPAEHVGVSERAIAAGKHVWSEKPLGLDRAKVRGLLDKAAAAGVRVGSAPDTLLGPGFQSAKRAIQSGIIGEPMFASTQFQTQGPDLWHPSPAFLFAQGAGPLLDIGPYYFGGLISLLGPVDRIAALGHKKQEVRKIHTGPNAGDTFPVEVPSTIQVITAFEGGTQAQSLLSFDSALERHGVSPGTAVAILSSNDPTAFTCVFGISRAGAVWCPINPRNEAGENRELLAMFGCRVLIFQAAFAPLVDAVRTDLPALDTLVCLDADLPWALTWAAFLDAGGEAVDRQPVDDLAMIVGTGGTTGRPKGVQLTGSNLETMTAITLMSYPWQPRPVYLALAPLTHAAGVLCFPVLCHGGSIVVMRSPDVGNFLDLVERHRVTHTFLPPTLIYLVLDHPSLDGRDLGSLQCFWYGAAPMSAARLEEALTRIGPVMAQLFGQTEAPMMLSTLPPAEHFRADGSIARERLTSAGRAAPLVTLAIMADDGSLLPRGERGEIVARS
ncbi:MAG: AMP-binding protein, partial [Jatrophihabitans endophyticus]